MITFTDVKNLFTITVKDDFLNKCPSPSQMDYMTLLADYNLMNYLHNPSGPAIVRHSDGRSEHWIDGSPVENS